MPSAAAPLDLSSHLKLPALTPRKRRSTPPNLQPVPETPDLPYPLDISALSPSKPAKRILTSRDHDLFVRSPTYNLVLSFVLSLSESCTDTKISSLSLATQQPVVRALQSVLTSIYSLVDACPPVDQGTSRFGNPAFKDFLDILTSNLHKYHEAFHVPGLEWETEVSTYLEHSFGSRARIDYGSGHELNFVMWLLCLNRLSILKPSEFQAVTLIVFPLYIRVLRKIQSVYYLEPAGSHGVWGLDDYHFLPFLFGASQLLHHPYIHPLAIHNDLILEEEGDDYMYLDMVRWTMATKTVKGLKWTQPMLDDISGAKSWMKVEQGMKRMFVKEVLGKLPIMQHFMFGTLIPAVEGMNEADDSRDIHSIHKQHMEGPGHVQRDDAWGDCCGIKIPSIVAAAQEAKKSERDHLRRVPFD